MFIKLESCVLIAVVIALACENGAAQTAPASPGAIYWNDVQNVDIPVVPGSSTTLDVVGPVGVPFALATSRALSSIEAPWGTVEIDLHHASFTLMVDGFDPGHPQHTLGTLDANGAQQFTFVPFPVGSQLGETHFIQVLVATPGSSDFFLTNTVGVRSSGPPPVVTDVQPKLITPGLTVWVTGMNFDDNAVPIAELDGLPMTVVSHTDTHVEAIVPVGARSGYVQITNDNGTSHAYQDSLGQFVMVTGQNLLEGTGFGSAANPITADSSIQGAVNLSTERDTYWISCNAGEEVRAEAFPFDTSTFELIDSSYPNQGFLDPFVEIFVTEISSGPVAFDDNSGPALSSAIGTAGPRKFIAPYTGLYQLVVSSSYSYSTGDYLLNVSFRQQNDITPVILQTSPNNSAPGMEVEVLAWGLDMANPTTNLVEFPTSTGTISAPTYLNANGRIAVTIPAGVVTGHIVAKNPTGLASVFNGDHFPSTLYIWETGIVEDPATIQTITSGTGVVGTISTQWELDLYEFVCNAGDEITVRAYPYDVTSGLILPGVLFSSAVLDPEVLIMGAGGQGMFTADAHSGPALAAEIGGPSRPAWVAPAGGTYSLGVRPWFFISTGTYLLDLKID